MHDLEQETIKDIIRELRDPVKMDVAAWEDPEDWYETPTWCQRATYMKLADRLESALDRSARGDAVPKK